MNLKHLKQLSVLNGQTAIAGLVLVQSWTATIKKMRIVISRSFFLKRKKSSSLC